MSIEIMKIIIIFIMFLGPPNPPFIFSHGLNDLNNFYVAVEDTYTGHSDILNYTVIVQDITSFKTIIVHQKQEEGATYINFPTKLKKVMSPLCGPQSLSVRSTNAVGTSLPTTARVESNNSLCMSILHDIDIAVLWIIFY